MAFLMGFIDNRHRSGCDTFTLQSRATDVTGATQPATVPYNTREYLYDGIVNHTITVV
jgi:hypothetical protein